MNFQSVPPVNTLRQSDALPAHPLSLRNPYHYAYDGRKLED
jgi:hypothetical protein